MPRRGRQDAQVPGRLHAALFRKGAKSLGPFEPLEPPVKPPESAGEAEDKFLTGHLGQLREAEALEPVGNRSTRLSTPGAQAVAAQGEQELRDGRAGEVAFEQRRPYAVGRRADFDLVVRDAVELGEFRVERGRGYEASSAWGGAAASSPRVASCSFM